MGGLVPQSSYESAGLPRGGGWGNVSNITFENADLTGAKNIFIVDENGGNNGSYTGSSKMLLSDIHLDNFYGVLANGDVVATITCSNVEPCYDIYFTNVTVQGSSGGVLTGSCKYTEADGVHGLSGC
jgi:galacturan 1,4-alpha-galacturonidase